MSLHYQMRLCSQLPKPAQRIIELRGGKKDSTVLIFKDASILKPAVQSVAKLDGTYALIAYRCTKRWASTIAKSILEKHAWALVDIKGKDVAVCFEV